MKTEFTKTEEKKHYIVTCDVEGCSEYLENKHMPVCVVCGKSTCRHHTSYFYSDPSSDYYEYSACPEHKDLVQDAYDTREDLLNDIPSTESLIRGLAKSRGIEMKD